MTASLPASTPAKEWVLHEDDSEWYFQQGKLVPTHDAVERRRFNKAYAVAKDYTEKNHLDWGRLIFAMSRRTEYAIVFYKDLDPQTNNGASGAESEINVRFDGKITWIGVPKM